jgi:hypothetical protein
MVDGLVWHNSLGTISFAASRLCVSEFFKLFPSTTTFASSVIRLLRKKETHAKPQRRKEEACGGAIAGDSRISKLLKILRKHRGSVAPALFLERTT